MPPHLGLIRLWRWQNKLMPWFSTNLGGMYTHDEGIPENDVEAFKWYRKAAQQGNAIAQSNLGFMYDNGEGVPGNDAEAVKWYKKAAE